MHNFDWIVDKGLYPEREWVSVKLPLLEINSGKLVVGDVFTNLTSKHNLFFPIKEKQCFPLLWSSKEGTPKLLTIILNQELYARRMFWKSEGKHADVRYAFLDVVPSLTMDFQSCKTEDEIINPIETSSGSLVLVDAEDFEMGMPNKSEEWFFDVFECSSKFGWLNLLEMKDCFHTVDLPKQPYDQRTLSMLLLSKCKDKKIRVVLEKEFDYGFDEDDSWQESPRAVALHIFLDTSI